MTDRPVEDSEVFFSANVVSKFRSKLDNASYSSILDAGLGEMIKDGVALKIADLDDPYSVVVFPKASPSRPYEMMMTVLPDEEGVPARSSVSDFSTEDVYGILRSGERIADELHNTALENSVGVSDGYIFQHFNPKDLNPKSMFNGSVSHLHLHAQMYGHSLKEFPNTFVPSGAMSDYEGANRLLSDSGVSVFYEIMNQTFPELDVTLENEGCVSYGSVSNDVRINEAEAETLKDIVRTWDGIWDEFSSCYVDRNPENQGDITLLPTDERVAKVNEILGKYPLSEGNRRVLLFLASNVKPESEDIWRNFYQGPNGAIGLHFDYEKGKRQWLIAPRIFRSWSRHLPLIRTQNNPTMEWTTKNESGDGLVNFAARDEIYQIQRRVVQGLKESSQ